MMRSNFDSSQNYQDLGLGITEQALENKSRVLYLLSKTFLIQWIFSQL